MFIHSYMKLQQIDKRGITTLMIHVSNCIKHHDMIHIILHELNFVVDFKSEAPLFRSLDIEKTKQGLSDDISSKSSFAFLFLKMKVV